VVVGGITHPVDERERKGRIRPPDLASHLPFVGTPGAVAIEKAVEGIQECCRSGVIAEAPFETGQTVLKVNRQLWRFSDEATQSPQGIGRSRRVHLAQTAQQCHQVLTATTGGPPQSIQTNPGTTGDG